MYKKFIAVDQYGNTKFLSDHPRKELMDYWGTSHANKMYRNMPDGTYKHVGYIVRGHWYEVLEISPLSD
jgi:hypothetical protein